MSVIDWDVLNKKVDAVSQALKSTNFQYEKILLSKQEKETCIAKSKAAVEMQPEINAILDNLQNRVHEKLLGHFESLLTALIQDVFPEDEKKVSLELRLERNQPSLRVTIVTPEGFKEDAFSGRGGSIANVLSMGLRFIVLTRTSQLRPFIVFDEPDCWLKPDRVYAFASVIRQMSERLGVQVFLMSHHDISFFPNVWNVHISKKNGLMEYSTRGEKPEWDEGQKGIRSIKLQGFMAHHEATIPLSPGVTILTGDNDIGKSAVVQALRSVVHGEGHESYVRHGAQKYTISIDFGPEGVLTHERRVKGARKEYYSLERNNEISHESEKAKTPEWILEELGLGLVEEFDVQLKTQKDPVFLINQTGITQARLLSIGRESQYLVGMQEDYKSDIMVEKKYLKKEEKEYAKISNILAKVSNFPVVKENTEKLINDEYGKIKKNEQTDLLLEEYVKRLDSKQKIVDLSINDTPGQKSYLDTAILKNAIGRIDLLTKVSDKALPHEVEQVSILQISDLSNKINKIQNLSPVKKLPANIQGSSIAIKWQDINSLLQVVSRIERTVRVQDLPNLPKQVDSVEHLDTSEIVKTGKKINELIASGKKTVAEKKGVEEKIKECIEEKEAIIKSCGNICPVCNNIWNHEGETCKIAV